MSPQQAEAFCLPLELAGSTGTLPIPGGSHAASCMGQKKVGEIPRREEDGHRGERWGEVSCPRSLWQVSHVYRMVSRAPYSGWDQRPVQKSPREYGQERPVYPYCRGTADLHNVLHSMRILQRNQRKSGWDCCAEVRADRQRALVEARSKQQELRGSVGYGASSFGLRLQLWAPGTNRRSTLPSSTGGKLETAAEVLGFRPASPWPLARPTRAVPLNPALSGSCAVEIHTVSEVSPKLVTEAPRARTHSLGQHPATSLLHVTHSSEVLPRAYPSRCSPKLAGCVLPGSKVLEGTLTTGGVPPFPLSRCEVDLKLIHPFPLRGQSVCSKSQRV